MSKTVQIDRKLFFDLAYYWYHHYDISDPLCLRIQQGLASKLDAMMQHDRYTAYLTAATKKERIRAREEYLNHVGVHASFRWPDDHDIHIDG